MRPDQKRHHGHFPLPDARPSQRLFGNHLGGDVARDFEHSSAARLHCLAARDEDLMAVAIAMLQVAFPTAFFTKPILNLIAVRGLGLPR